MDAGEVALLKRVLYAGSGAIGIGVSRVEAEAGGDQRRLPRRRQRPEWRDLFVRGVANAILVAATYQAPSAQEALRRQAWLNDANDIDFASVLTRPLRETLRSSLPARRGRLGQAPGGRRRGAGEGACHRAGRMGLEFAA